MIRLMLPSPVVHHLLASLTHALCTESEYIDVEGPSTSVGRFASSAHGSFVNVRVKSRPTPQLRNRIRFDIKRKKLIYKLFGNLPKHRTTTDDAIDAHSGTIRFISPIHLPI